MGFEDNFGINIGPSAWTPFSPRASNNLTTVASNQFGQAFSQAWPIDSRSPKMDASLLSSLAKPEAVKQAPTLIMRTVASGDTLSGLVKAQAQSQGVQLSGPQIMRMTQTVAEDNKIANANLIFPGQQINMTGLAAELDANLKEASADAAVVAKTTSTAAVLQAYRSANVEPATATAAMSVTPVTAPAAIPALVSRAPASRHDVLDKTLNRAVAKGYIPAAEKNDVRDKILDLAKTHKFNPDDFARMTLMESDGMNPRSTNQRCHGIIQFCDGSDRGAASAGYATNPKAILGLSVYQQLHLVDKYFDDVGLKNKGKSGLDDLYLSVLMPSARSEVRTDVALPIGNNQARALYEGRDTSAPMTRESILQGLLKNAADRLGQSSTASGRLQAIRTAAYEHNTALPQRQQ
jgi:hypothetical protein